MRLISAFCSYDSIGGYLMLAVSVSVCTYVCGQVGKMKLKCAGPKWSIGGVLISLSATELVGG